jgi:hypothetical protein
LIEELSARGHSNVIAKHLTTFEITKDTNLTRRGDCVIAVNATKGPRDLSVEFRNLCRHDESKILVELEVDGIVDSIEGRGSPKLALSHSSELVGRKSSYVSDRTVMIRSDKGACDLGRELIDALTSPSARLRVRITAEF